MPWDRRRHPPIGPAWEQPEWLNGLPSAYLYGFTLRIAELALWSKGKGVYPLEWGRSAAALAAALGCVSRGPMLEQKLRTSEGMQLAKGKRTGVN